SLHHAGASGLRCGHRSRGRPVHRAVSGFHSVAGLDRRTHLLPRRVAHRWADEAHRSAEEELRRPRPHTLTRPRPSSPAPIPAPTTPPTGHESARGGTKSRALRRGSCPLAHGGEPRMSDTAPGGTVVSPRAWGPALSVR